MNLSKTPPSAFISPWGRNALQVRDLTSRIVELSLKYAEGSGKRHPCPEDGFDPQLAEIPPAPLSERALIETVSKIMEGSVNVASPGYIAHMNAIPALASVVGDFVASVLDNNMISVELSPLLTRLEDRMLRNFARLFGLGNKGGGILVGGGSLGNLQALTVARNVKLKVLEDGIDSLNGKPVILASEVAHTSLQKAAMIMGLGSSAVIPVAVTRNSKMDVSDLNAKIQEARKRGQIPFCLVATAGTTTTGNIDPIEELARVAQDNDLWFHVDAAYAGAFIISESQKSRFRGIEAADSLLFNPHKCFYVARTCSMVLFRDFSVLERHFRIPVPYMVSYQDTVNRSEISVHGTAHADILKLWITLNHIGLSGYRELFDQFYRLTEYFVRRLRQRPFIELASEPETNIVCFRCTPSELPMEQWDKWNADIQEKLRDQKNIFVSLPRYRNSLWLRVVLMNPHTDETVIDRLLECIDFRMNSLSPKETRENRYGHTVTGKPTDETQ